MSKISKQKPKSNAGRKPTWTPKQLEDLKKYFPTMKNSELATILNKNESQIRNQAFRFKLKKSAHYWPDKDERFLLKHYNNGMTVAEIAEKLNRTPNAVSIHYTKLRKDIP
jgi:DNA-binding NarL/FixJ family response regulator